MSVFKPIDDFWRSVAEKQDATTDTCYVCGGPAGECRCCAFCEKRRCECGETVK